ncbi:hypothetical protein SY2F82_45740 [Streptomyces sp. Y2F8-2]|uniref:hypothetical protein n=1 Tax=unclassified Streptomyces TaxID=2593676 RepID=UPI001904C47B|nr:hypothetical protein [Streptomyces sp. Y2F8-2]GHK02777.1 hypothetical protein SY2F82_45740 [Streptomyces sp. Y2F8-2]
MTDLELLAAFPATGEGGVVVNDWERAEAALKVTFPPAFMRFLDMFGGAKFDDFLRVYRAGADNKNVDLPASRVAASSPRPGATAIVRTPLACEPPRRPTCRR